VVQLYIPFTHPQAAEGAELDGALPVAALRRDDIKVKLSSGDFGGFPGVTFNNLDTFKVFCHWRAHHKVLVPPYWRIRTQNEARKKFNIDPGPGYLYYLDLFDTEESSGWDFDHSDYADLQVLVGQGRLEQWDSPATPAMLHNLAARRHDLGADTLDTSAPEWVPLIRELRNGALASKQPRGKAQFRAGTRSSHDETTLQWRVRGTRTDSWRAAIFKRLGIPSGGRMGQQLIAARGDHVPPAIVPHVPEAVVWPSMPYPAVVDHAKAKFPKTFGG